MSRSMRRVCQSLVYLAIGPDEPICGIFLEAHVCNGLLFLQYFSRYLAMNDFEL